MKKTNRVLRGSALVPLVLALGVMAVSAQEEAPPLPEDPVAAPLPAGSEEITGPGPLFPGIMMDLPAGDDLEAHGYVMREYFVTGTAQGRPYTTRVLVRRPVAASRFSGIVVAEGMHPSGNSWMFQFTHRYVMSEGHAAVEIVTSGLQHFTGFNEARYRRLRVEPEQANDVIAQVGALLKSGRPDRPLADLPVRRLVLTGTSASAGILNRYLPAHMVYRLPDMGPIVDGFLPTSNIADLPGVDVPLIQIPTMTEVERLTADARRRPDGDAPGDQFRTYEFAGMSHNDSRFNLTYEPDPCKYPVSRFPVGAFMAVGLHHLVQWADKGVVPPRGARLAIEPDGEAGGVRLVVDAHGNARGGIRNTYVDLPTVRYGVRNEGADPPIPNPSRLIATRPMGTADQLCGLAGYEEPLPPAQLRSLYGSRDEYLRRVERRLDELTEEGWFLPAYRDIVLGDAGRIEIP